MEGDGGGASRGRGGVPIDDASAIADRLTQYETVVAHCDANRQCEDLQAELASTRLQLENAQQETTRLKRLAPKKKFAIDTTAPTHGLPQFPAGRSPRDRPALADSRGVRSCPRRHRQRSRTRVRVRRGRRLRSWRISRGEG